MRCGLREAAARPKRSAAPERRAANGAGVFAGAAVPASGRPGAAANGERATVRRSPADAARPEDGGTADAPIPKETAAANEEDPAPRRRPYRGASAPHRGASAPPERGTITLEEAEILRHEHHRAGQHVLRLYSPAVAARAAPGSFVHLRCGPALAMRRPMSVMRTDPARGWFDVLFKEAGAGTRRLARRGPGERLSVLGPIGRGFAPSPDRPRRLLIGGGVGIPPILFLAERLAASRPVVLMGSEVPFPFDLRPSVLSEPGLPAGTGLGGLEDLAIPSRTASRAGLPGCFDGLVTDLARTWLEARPSGAGVELFACGPEPMLRAVAGLAEGFGVPSQLALEEYMACGTGGCAGCTVRVRTPDGPRMKRVCVDGPVFDGAAVFGAR